MATADVEEFQIAVNINIVGQLIAAQAFLKHKAPNATLIAINAAMAHVYYTFPAPGYVATKAASARLMEQIAVENNDVRVFNLHPGVIKTAMAEKAGNSHVAEDSPEMAAGFAVWLASSEAEFLRGRFLWGNWDVDELKKMNMDGAFEKDPSLFQMTLGGWPFEHMANPAWAG